MTGCDIKDGEKHVILLRGNEVLHISTEAFFPLQELEADLWCCVTAIATPFVYLL